MQVAKWLGGFRVLRSLLLIAVLVSPITDQRAAAGTVVLGTMNPSNPGGVSIGIDGIAFDGTANALVLDRWSWDIERVSVQDASVISTTTSTPVRNLLQQPVGIRLDHRRLLHVYTNQYWFELPRALIKIRLSAEDRSVL